MDKLSKWSQINLLLASIFLIVGFLSPILIEKFSYRGKMSEAKSVARNIAENQGENYSLKNEYIPIKKREQFSLTKKFNKIGKADLKYFDYTITTTRNSFTIVAEPKIKFLKTREVPPKIYRYTHVLNNQNDIEKWSSL